MTDRHTIEIDEDVDNDRSYWQCDCGRSGSAATYKADIAAEKHVPKGAFVVWRSHLIAYRCCAKGCDDT